MIIVGHGPGIGQGRGKEIDSHDIVIRFADYFYNRRDKDFGTKTTYLMTIDQKMADVLNNNVMPEIETWVFGRPGWTTQEQAIQRIGKFKPYVCTETNQWLKRFKEIGAKGYISKRVPDQPHFSQGLAAIIMAGAKLKPDVLTLAGFDNLIEGKNGNYEALTNNRTINSYHDFEAENILMEEIATYYEFEVRVF